MALQAIEGIYEDGKVELQERPKGVRKARVLVTFLPEEDGSAEEQRAALRRQFLERLQRGVDFGTEPVPTREELHADRLRR